MTLSLLAVVTLAGLLLASQRRLVRLTRATERWLDGAEAADTAPAARPRWRVLEDRVAVLGSAYAQRGERLHREQPWRRELVDAITLPALLFDGDGHLMAANQAAHDTFGTVRADPLTALQALGSTALAEAVNLARQSERPVELEAQLAGDRDVYGVASPVGAETLLVVSDRTAQRRLGEMRRDFVANASHELKSPVAGIQALAEALEATIDRDPSRVRELVGRLTEEAERLSKLVHDLLDLRRLESEEHAVTEAVDLVALVRDRAADVAAMAQARDVTLDLQLPDRAVVAGIEADLRVAVGNVLDNAVRYNRPGGRVSVSLLRSGGTYVLRIEDTGIGIPTSDIDRIFERFYRVDVARSRASGGTGLGLALVRHAVERHGGRIAVESLLGEGSSFTLVLPIEARGSAR